MKVDVYNKPYMLLEEYFNIVKNIRDMYITPVEVITKLHGQKPDEYEDLLKEIKGEFTKEKALVKAIDHLHKQSEAVAARLGNYIGANVSSDGKKLSDIIKLYKTFLNTTMATLKDIDREGIEHGIKCMNKTGLSREYYNTNVVTHLLKPISELAPTTDVKLFILKLVNATSYLKDISIPNSEFSKEYNPVYNQLLYIKNNLKYLGTDQFANSEHVVDNSDSHITPDVDEEYTKVYLQDEVVLNRLKSVITSANIFNDSNNSNLTLADATETLYSGYRSAYLDLKDKYKVLDIKIDTINTFGDEIYNVLIEFKSKVDLYIKRSLTSQEFTNFIDAYSLTLKNMLVIVNKDVNNILGTVIEFDIRAEMLGKIVGILEIMSRTCKTTDEVMSTSE